MKKPTTYRGRDKHAGGFPARMCTANGDWFALLREDERGKLWMRLGSVADTPPADAFACYRLAWFYFGAGILSKIQAFVFLEREEAQGGPVRMDVEALDREQQGAAPAVRA